MQKDTKMQTIAEFIEANGGVRNIRERVLTNGKNSWTLLGMDQFDKLALKDHETDKTLTLPTRLLQFLRIPGLRLAPRQVSVHQYAVKAKGRHAEVSAKHFASKEEAIKYYESLTNPGSVEWAQKLRHTEETRTEPESPPDAKESED
jgi:hypothetical protein